MRELFTFRLKFNVLTTNNGWLLEKNDIMLIDDNIYEKSENGLQISYIFEAKSFEDAKEIADKFIKEFNTKNIKMGE